MAANLYRREFRRTYDYDFLVTTFDGLKDALEAADFEVEGGTHGTQDQWLIRATVDDVGFDFSLAEIDIQQLTITHAQGNEGIATVEDLIILKLIAHRTQDRDDLSSIIKSGRELDMDYLANWSAKLNDDFQIAPRFVRFQESYVAFRANLEEPDVSGPTLGIK